MQSLDDISLLRQYATGRSETAFETLVNRRIGFVYSAALRQVGEPQLAQEVTQTVFIILARKAGNISHTTVLTGWLFNTTRLTALAQIRAAARRRAHEQEVQMETEIEAATADPLWKQMSPVLDEALSTLGEKDRRAVLLRFFENKSLAEVGNSLGAGEDAARKRVARALEKLHGYFMRRGVSSTTALLAAAISNYSVHAAPAALAKTVTVAAVAKGVAAGGSTLTLVKGALKLMAWSKTQTATVGLVVAGMATVAVIQHQSQNRLRDENRLLRQQMEDVQADNERLSNLVSQVNGTPQAQSNPSDELLRLRGEVGVLRRQTNDLLHSLASAQNGQASRSTQGQGLRPPNALSEDYPQTPEAATKGIFQTLSRGDLEAFFTNFAEPGVPKEMYDRIFNNERIKSYLSGLEVVSVGQPTNSFGPNMWFVPYNIRLQDGSEKEMQLHVAQDPRTQRWYFKGGI
jgi:RNA polymerase sigma factor (sigma-70 family)